MWIEEGDLSYGYPGIQESPRQTEERGQQASPEVHQRTRHLWKNCKVAHAPLLPGGWPAGQQLCRKRPEGAGRHRVEHVPATCPCSKEGWQQTRLIPGGSRRRAAGRLREGILPFCSAPVGHIWSLDPWYKRDWQASCNWPQRWAKDWSACHIRGDWESWDYWGSRRDGSGSKLISVH